MSAIPSGQHRLEAIARSMEEKFDRPTDGTGYPHDITELPDGASVRIVFEGVVRKGPHLTHMNLRQPDGSTLRVSWEQHGDAIEDYAPQVFVDSFGFKPGDVAVFASGVTGGPEFVTVFALAPVGKANGIRWCDLSGEIRTVDEADLTLLVRDSFRVGNSDD